MTKKTPTTTPAKQALEGAYTPEQVALANINKQTHLPDLQAAMKHFVIKKPFLNMNIFIFC